MKISQLELDIISANQAYANGTPYLTDNEYHSLWQQLYNIDPTNKFLYHTSYDPTIQSYEFKHIKPIYGTQKAFNIDDLKPFLTRFKGQELLIEPKYDGVGAVIYRTQDSYRLVLQGDGTKGKDITHHLDKIIFNQTDESYSEVELIIPYYKWTPTWGANPRNVVAGWLNRDELEHHDIIMAIPHHGSYPYGVITNYKDLTELNERLLFYHFEWSQDFPIDGLMIKVKDEKERLKASHNGSYNLWSIAWKPPIQTKETKVVNIQYNVSRSGRIIPKVEYEPIELCGTTNTFVTANNCAWIKEKNIHIGSKITIGKAGEIIPKIISIEPSNQEIELPTLCPICKTLLTWHGRDLICTGEYCIAKLSKQIAYFYSDKGMDLKSIGEAMITELLYTDSCYQTLIKKPWALLDPDEYGILGSIHTTWGEAKTNRYLDELDNINNKKNPAHFVASLGYKNLAYKKSLAQWQQFASTHSITGLMKVFIMAINKWLEATGELNTFKFTTLPTQGKTYCITGTLSANRNDIIDYLTQYNLTFVNQVSRKISFLLLGDLKNESTKLNKAKELGVPIINEHQIKDYI